MLTDKTMSKKSKGLAGFKNVIWALSIYAALAAILVGVIVSLSCKFSGDRPDGTLYLGERTVTVSGDKSNSSHTPSAAEAGELTEMKKTQDQGLEHVLAMTFLCDSSVSGLKTYSSGGVSPQVWTDAGSGIPVVGAAGTDIVYPGDGSLITPVNAAMVAEPSWIVICLGRDDSPDVSRDTFIQSYEELIAQLRAASPNTTVVCCSIASVSASYSDDEGRTSSFYRNVNSWIGDVCRNSGTFYADLGSVLNDSDGDLAPEYDSGDGKTVNSAGISRIIEYFRFHGVK